MSIEPTIVTPGEPDFYANTQWERVQHGAIIIDGQEVATTMCCPHCSGHFISRKGSGHRRTWCMNCSAVTCGRPECDACFPFEKRLDMYEKLVRLNGLG